MRDTRGSGSALSMQIWRALLWLSQLNQEVAKQGPAISVVLWCPVKSTVAIHEVPCFLITGPVSIAVSPRAGMGF